MIVIIKAKNITTIYKFRRKLIRYYLCIIINKIRGHEVEILNEKDI